MSNAMQDMLLNMLLPKEEQEALKKALTPDNIKKFMDFIKHDYQGIKEQLKRIEEKLDDNRSGRGKPIALVTGAVDVRDLGDVGSGTGTNGRNISR